MGIRIGGSLGKVVKVDVGDKGFSMGCYLRVRVILDISQPLSRGRIVRAGGLDSRWVEFKYERLPVFCYLCGRLDHDEKECLVWLSSADPITAENKQFGPWLRATPDRLQKSHVVLGQRAGESIRPGQWGARLPERDLQLRQQEVAADVRHKTNKETDTNDDRADVESWTRESERFKEKVPGETEKPNFEEQLRVLDAEISGKTDKGCNREKVPMTRKLVSEVEKSAKQMDGKGGKAYLDC